MLELRAVTAGYEGHQVLRDVSLVVPEGAVAALLGPNGAGKTTLLRVAAGALPPTSGRLLLEGVDVTGQPPHRLANAGVCHIPQGRGVFKNLTVRDNVRLQQSRNFDGDAVALATDTFPHLARHVDQIAGTMSGGEQQILALAHAYVSKPKVILVDELSMGLAPKVVGEIFEYLRDLAATGVSLLLVEQYVTRALDLADYVYVLNKGCIVFAGEPRELQNEAIMATYLGEVG